MAAAFSVVVAATFARTLSSTNHHAGQLRLIVQFVQSVAQDRSGCGSNQFGNGRCD
jgi:hypothetical protein